MQQSISSLFPVAKTALVGVVTTAELTVNPDWKIVAVNGAVSVAFAIITHFAAKGGRYKSRRTPARKNRSNSAADNTNTK